MRKFRTRVTVIGGVILCSQVAAAQSPGKYAPPRGADGRPSFEGVWTNATITTLQRPAKFKNLVLDAAEVEKETNSNPQVVRQRDDDKQNETTVHDGSELARGRGYKAFWIDPGMTFNQVRGEYRTSFIID